MSTLKRQTNSLPSITDLAGILPASFLMPYKTKKRHSLAMPFPKNNLILFY